MDDLVLIDLGLRTSRNGRIYGDHASGVGSDSKPFTVLLACGKIEGKHTFLRNFSHFWSYGYQIRIVIKVRDK